MKERDDTGYMQTVDPDFEPNAEYRTLVGRGRPNARCNSEVTTATRRDGTAHS